MHIIAVVLLGFLLMPTLTFACGSQSENKPCTVKTSTNMDKMDCSKHKNHSENKSDGCNGKCVHHNCITTSTQFCAAFFEIKFNNNNFDFTEKKQNYFNSNTNSSTGFYSIWLIPKIS